MVRVSRDLFFFVRGGDDWSVRNDDGISFTPFRKLWEGRKRVHIFPCMNDDPFELSELSLAVEHPDLLPSLHVEAGDVVISSFRSRGTRR